VSAAGVRLKAGLRRRLLLFLGVQRLLCLHHHGYSCTESLKGIARGHVQLKLGHGADMPIAGALLGHKGDGALLGHTGDGVRGDAWMDVNGQTHCKGMTKPLINWQGLTNIVAVHQLFEGDARHGRSLVSVSAGLSVCWCAPRQGPLGSCEANNHIAQASADATVCIMVPMSTRGAHVYLWYMPRNDLFGGAIHAGHATGL